jgi:CBS-domain-containing membrane protein
MKARDVMVSPVITVKSSASVKEVAQTFLERRISAVPVVDDQGKVIGIVSEGDLLHRAEAGTQRRHSWWLLALTGDEALAGEYIKAHARKVSDVMTTEVITATPDTQLHEVAALLEKHSIKRVPIVKDRQLVGIVSRANLIQAVAGDRKELDIPFSDATIRDKLLTHLKAQRWAHTGLLNTMSATGW